MRMASIILATTLVASTVTVAHADKLDDIMASGTLRCAVVLDYPPMGLRDAENNPAGYDVDYCNDIAKALGVTAEIVETTFPDRIPALVSGRADIAVAQTSDTLERAKTVGFTMPYTALAVVVLAKEGLGIDTYEKLKGRNVGGVAGGYEAMALEKDVKAWGGGSFRAFQSQADVFLALSQGQIEATVVTAPVAATIVKDGKYKGVVVAGETPYEIDYTALVTLRQEQGLINYLNLFIHQQVRTGRYKELWDKWVGVGEAPDLTIPGVYR